MRKTWKMLYAAYQERCWRQLQVPDIPYAQACQATARFPRQGSSWLIRGAAELHCSWYAAAEESLLRAIDHNAAIIEAWALLSIIWAAKHEPILAADAAQKVLLHRPDLAATSILVALHLYADGEISIACDLLNAITASGIYDPALMRIHVQLLGAVGEHQASIETLRLIWQQRQRDER